MLQPPRLRTITRTTFARVLTSILIGLTANSAAPPRVQAAAAPAPIPARTEGATSAATTQTGGFLCGLGGACLETGTDVLSLPERLLVVEGDKAWDRVVKGTAARAWQPLEFEARQTLSGLHGVPNDARLPRFAPDEMRALIFNRLIGIADRRNRAQQLQPAEAVALAALEQAVIEVKARPARLAIEEYNRWVSAPCDYRVPRYADGLTEAEREAVGPHPFDEYNPGTICLETRGDLFGTPNPPTVEQFVSYGALRASNTFASADSRAAAERTATAVLFAVGLFTAAAAAGIAALVTAAVGTAAGSIALALGVTFGSFTVAAGSAASGMAAAGIGVGAAASIVGVVIAAVVVTVVATVQQVERENVLPTLQAKLTTAQQTPNIYAMLQDRNQVTVLFTAFMEQTLPDYTAERLAASPWPIPQSRPAGAPRFRVGGVAVDGPIETLLASGDASQSYRQTFMADGWFVTRTSADRVTWTPWRWALTFPYTKAGGGRRIVGIQADGFLDTQGDPNATLESAVKTTAFTPALFGASGAVEWSGNRPPMLAPTSTDPEISAGNSITFLANAADPDGTIAAIRWYVDDGTFSTANTPSFAACTFGDPPLDQGGLPTVCPWRPYDDAGSGIAVTFGIGGVRNVRVVAMDNDGAISAQQFTVTVGALTPSITVASPPPAAITEGQPITIAGTFDLPAGPEGYFTTAQFTLNWGDGTRVVQDRPCAFASFDDPTAPRCTIINGSYVGGAGGPWVFAPSKTFAFRPDRPSLSSVPISLSVLTGQGVLATPVNYQLAVTNVQPFVYLFPVCENVGPQTCDRTTTDTRRPYAGQAMTLRGYINDVAPAAHGITVLWGDGTSSVLQPGCTEDGCPVPVTTGPTIPFFTSPHPWKQFTLTHTFTGVATFPVRIMVNDGGPQGVVTVATSVTTAGLGALTGTSVFPGLTRQSFTLQRTLNDNDVLTVSETACGSGTLVNWDDATGVLTCDFPEVGLDSESEVHVRGTYNGADFTRALLVTTTPIPLEVTSLSGPQVVSSGSLAEYTYEVSGPTAAVATTTVTPSCGLGGVWSAGPGSFVCIASDNPGLELVGVTVDTSLEQSVARRMIVEVVPDVVPPTVGPLPDLTVNATSNDGATVFYATGVSDNDMRGIGSLTTTCTPPANSLFPIGTSPVTCSATDRSGNTGSTSFTVTVRDTVPPTLSTPPDVRINASSPTGAVVTYSLPTASDAPGVTPVVSCSPASGSRFAIGINTATCTATDSAGNQSRVSFQVEVLGALAQVAALRTYVQGLTFDAKEKRQMLQTLDQLRAALTINDIAGACTRVRTLIGQATKVKTGLSAQQQQAIVTDASRIGAVIGC